MACLEPLGGPIEGNEPGATRRDVARVLFKRRWLIITCFVVVSAVTLMGVAMLPPTYEAKGKVLVQTEQQATPTFFSGLAAYSERRDFDPASRRLETEMGVIGAAPLSAQVVRELGLGWDDVYHSPLGHLGVALTTVARPWLERAFGLHVSPPSEGQLVADFQQSLGVSPSESKSSESTSNIIVITLKAPKPQIARDALAHVLDRYLEFDRRLNEEAGTKALDLVTKELTDAEHEVSVAEESMRRFLAAANFDPARPESARHLGQEPDAGLITTPGDDHTIAELKSAQVGLEVELTRAREIYLPSSEKIRSLERSVDELQKRVADEVRRNADNYARFNQLDRRLRTAEARLNDLRRREAEISLFVQVNHRPNTSRVVIEPPMLPEKSDWPRRVLIAAAGSLAGLVLGLGFAGLGEYTDDTLPSKRDVRRQLGVEVLAVIPKATSRELQALGPPSQALPSPDSHLGMRWRPIVEALAQKLAMGRPDDRAGSSILVTSARSGEGKTFTAGLLARGLSQLGFGTVLLVDADINSSRSSRDGNPSPGTVLPTTRLAEDPTPDTPRTTLTTLAPDDTSEAAGDPTGMRLQRFLERERSRFNWIIFDGGAVGRGGVNALAREVDVVVLVIAAEETRRSVVQDSFESLELDRKKVKGVLNWSRYHIPTFLYDEI